VRGGNVRCFVRRSLLKSDLSFDVIRIAPRGLRGNWEFCMLRDSFIRVRKISLLCVHARMNHSKWAHRRYQFSSAQGEFSGVRSRWQRQRQEKWKSLFFLSERCLRSISCVLIIASVNMRILAGAIKMLSKKDGGLRRELKGEENLLKTWKKNLEFLYNAYCVTIQRYCLYALIDDWLVSTFIPTFPESFPPKAGKIWDCDIISKNTPDVFERSRFAKAAFHSRLLNANDHSCVRYRSRESFPSLGDSQWSSNANRCKFAASPCRDLRNASNSFRRAKSFFRLHGRGAIKLLLVRTSRRHSIFGM